MSMQKQYKGILSLILDCKKKKSKQILLMTFFLNELKLTMYYLSNQNGKSQEIVDYSISIDNTYNVKPYTIHTYAIG